MTLLLQADAPRVATAVSCGLSIWLAAAGALAFGWALRSLWQERGR